MLRRPQPAPIPVRVAPKAPPKLTIYETGRRKRAAEGHRALEASHKAAAEIVAKVPAKREDAVEGAPGTTSPKTKDAVPPSVSAESHLAQAKLHGEFAQSFEKSPAG